VNEWPGHLPYLTVFLKLQLDLAALPPAKLLVVNGRPRNSTH
jgi:hypothetical protein